MKTLPAPFWHGFLLPLLAWKKLGSLNQLSLGLTILYFLWTNFESWDLIICSIWIHLKPLGHDWVQFEVHFASFERPDLTRFDFKNGPLAIVMTRITKPFINERLADEGPYRQLNVFGSSTCCKIPWFVHLVWCT